MNFPVSRKYIGKICYHLLCVLCHFLLPLLCLSAIASPLDQALLSNLLAHIPCIDANDTVAPCGLAICLSDLSWVRKCSVSLIRLCPRRWTQCAWLYESSINLVPVFITCIDDNYSSLICNSGNNISIDQTRPALPFHVYLSLAS